ncbi:MAG: extradiol ring-cleavage dioxygenase [Nitrospinae bacterium]|nr:extradiol ring-cleavage dioxygenase [Nitrospinota bacterium]
MARIALGLATSHSPQLSLPPENWLRRGEEDQRNPSLYRVPDGKHVTFEELLAEADPKIAKELTPAVFQKRYDANQQGIARLAEALERIAPDVLVILGDDQQEAFHDDNMPAFCVYWGEQVPYVPRRTGGTGALTTWAYPKEAKQYPGHPALALHIIDSMMEQGFDVAHSKYLQEGQSITHAVTFVFARIMQGKNIPVVPIMQNTYYPPNQPRPRRSYEFGTALRNAIETWKSQARVAVVGSGGLSHFVVDEELDRQVLKVLQEKDIDAIASLPLARLQSGSSEIRNWITTAGAVQHLDMDIVDYVPCYRSPAGTGCAMAFAQWT